MNEKTIKNWIKISEYDIETGEAMLRTGRYLYVAYTCQQAIEKILKAYYVKEKGITPPYIHNLRRLISELSIINEISNEQSEFIDFINSYYIEARYSEELDILKLTLNEKKATEIFNKTKTFIQWIKMKLT